MKEKVRKVCAFSECGEVFYTTDTRKKYCDGTCQVAAAGVKSRAVNGYNSVDDKEFYDPVLKQVVPFWYKQDPTREGKGRIEPVDLSTGTEKMFIKPITIR